MRKCRQNKNWFFPVILLFIFNLVSPAPANAQIVRKSKIEFPAIDSLLITADHYYSRKEYPYILLFHTELSSRGEVDSLAQRFVKMRYNCLAVDLRSGDKYGFVKNETAERALAEGLDVRIEAGEKDIISTLEFVKSLTYNPVLLLGSSSSASLCIKVAAGRDNIGGILAFSPGEFFLPEFGVPSVLPDFNTPVFIAGNATEEPYLNEMFSGLPDKYKSLMTPSGNSLGRGSELLLSGNPARDEYWMAVLIFIKSLNEIPDGEVPCNPL